MNHRYFIVIYLLLQISAQSVSQENLIRNGDFEEFWECPQSLTEIERCKYVYNPCYHDFPQWSSTSDYFNRCAPTNTDCSVPFNTFGYQEPRSGDGYLGLSNAQNISNYKEYVQLSFKEELKPYATYSFSVYVNLCDAIGYSSDVLHFKFTDTLIYYNELLSEVMEPNVTLSNLTITDTVEWVELSFNYLSMGGEKYIIIGNFNNQSNLDCFYVQEGSNPLMKDEAYFYFDDASLILIKEADPITFPNVFTPNNDDKNDVFEPLSGQEHMDKMVVVNRWGNVIYESTSTFSWDGKNFNGVDVKEGVYFVMATSKIKKECKQENYQGVVHLLR